MDKGGAKGRLTEAQRKVLWKLARHANDAAGIGCSIGTLKALSRRGLIYVATTFDSIAFPLLARAEITDEGRRALTAAKDER